MDDFQQRREDSDKHQRNHEGAADEQTRMTS